MVGTKDLGRHQKNINWNRFTYQVNHDFFKEWSSRMAYILGFSFADGNIYKTTLAWDLKDDKELLEKINRSMSSNYPITQRKASFRLRISSPIIVNDLEKLGLIPNKSKKMVFPDIPDKYLCHFVRGFLDGDGWIYIRPNRNEISLGFSTGSKVFLEKLTKKLVAMLKLGSNNVRLKKKITFRGVKSISYQADYFWENAYKVLLFLYSDILESDLYLERKYDKYLKAIELYKWVKSGGRKWRVLEKNTGKSMKDLLLEYWKAGYNGPQIAAIIGVHHSSIYRWLIKTGVRPAFQEVRRKGVVND